MAAEKNWQNRLIKYLRENGCYVLNVPGSAQIPKGTPDLIVCANGRFMALELKAPNGRVSELQKHHIGEIRKSGGYAEVLKPDDFEAFKIKLAGMME